MKKLVVITSSHGQTKEERDAVVEQVKNELASHHLGVVGVSDAFKIEILDLERCDPAIVIGVDDAKASAAEPVVRKFVHDAIDNCVERVSAHCGSQADLGTSKPPPPPPPPSVVAPRTCTKCHAVEGDGRQGCLESMPPQHRWSK